MKRLVLERCDQPPMILGHFMARVPEAIENVPVRDEVLPLITLVRVDTRAAYYRTPLATARPNKSFNPAQR